jgi:beta-lactamase class A
VSGSLPDTSFPRFRSPLSLTNRTKIMIRIAVVFLLFSLTSPAAEMPSQAGDAIASLQARHGGRLGVAALDTGSGRRISHRAGERFLMCSTFKFLAVAAVLHRVDLKEDRLDRFVPYSAADLLEYAPVTREHVRDGRMSLGALCAAALTLSDNTAGNLLLKSIGGPAGLTHYVRSLGDETTRLDRMEPELNSAPPADPRDSTTPAAMLNDLRALLLGHALSDQSRGQLNDWMNRNQTGAAMIRAGVPSTWQVGDKTGRGANGVTNDIAILRPPNRPPILLAIYSAGSNAPGEARTAAIAEVARLVIQALSRPEGGE